MIKIYGMPTCPDCTYVEEQIKENDRYQVIDIGAHVKNLKEFLRLRDSSPAFDGARRSGAAGIPCFLLEDGTVTLVPEEAGLRSRQYIEFHNYEKDYHINYMHNHFICSAGTDGTFEVQRASYRRNT